MLGKLGDGRAVDPLIEVLESAGWQTRLNAAEALGKLGDPRAIKPLLKIIEVDHDKIGEAAQIALEKLGYGTDDMQDNGTQTSNDSVGMDAVPEANA
jgi:HEAT repeat protein